MRVAIVNSKVVGFFIFKILTERSANYLDTNSGKEILEVKTIGVDSLEQRKGIGSYIFSQVESIAKEFNVENCYCVAWQRKEKVAMHNIHLNAGFIMQRVIKNYWKSDSIEKEYNCPECGNPCLCSAVIYHKKC